MILDATPNLTENYEGQTRHTTWPRRRNFDFKVKNKLRQSRGHIREESTTSTIVASLTSLPPSSLPHKPRRHNLVIRRFCLPMPNSQDEAPERNTTPRHHHSHTRSRVSHRQVVMTRSAWEWRDNKTVIPLGRSMMVTAAAITGSSSKLPHHLSRTSSGTDSGKSTNHHHHRSCHRQRSPKIRNNHQHLAKTTSG